MTGLAHTAVAAWALVRWRDHVQPDRYTGSGTRIAGEVLLGLVLLWGLLRLYRGLCLRRPVIVDTTQPQTVVSVPSPRLARLYRRVRVPAAGVVDVELVQHDSWRRAERRYRLSVGTTSGPFVSDAITSPYNPRRNAPLPAAVSVTEALRAAVRGR